ncbi:MAG: ribonuclease HII [Candidatus Eisenbacteria bacterium]|nr:ribonuclease HII [Candidatus Eisenbacteria bacterium]
MRRRKAPARSTWQDRFLLLKRNEERYLTKTAGFVAGVDEAGRGPLAGPVVAAAVILPSDFCAEHIDDSKRLTHLQREKLYAEISAGALSVSWASVSERVVDGAGILNATHIAMRDAVGALSVAPSLVLVDGWKIPLLEVPQAAFPKADGTFLSVAAASIVAKFVRDSLMADAHERFPQYGFDVHKGYGTRQHIEALLRYGPCCLHRFSFRPVKEIQFMRRNSS